MFGQLKKRKCIFWAKTPKKKKRSKSKSQIITENEIKIAELEYQATLDQYRNAVENMSAEDVQTNEQYMFGLREKHIQFADSIQQLARSTDETISNAVVKEVNEMVIEYASKNNYDMIYGTSAAGNVVYGSDALDLTDLLTEVVNKNYEEE